MSPEEGLARREPLVPMPMTLEVLRGLWSLIMRGRTGLEIKGVEPSEVKAAVAWFNNEIERWKVADHG